MGKDYILEMNHVTKTFPGVTALSDVSFKVKTGEIHAICGENGAGKSTLMKILSGVYPEKSYEGKVFYNGSEIQFQQGAIRQAIEKGIAIVYQELSLVPFMTVGENIFLGHEPLKGKVINWNALYSRTESIFKEYGLDIPYSVQVGNLPVGKQQLVEIAKALSEDAKVLILDEPTSALTEVEIDKLMEILEMLRSNGVTCLYITHKLEEIFRICDTVTVLRDGKHIETRKTSEINTDQLISLMVGRDMTERFPVSNRKPGDVILSVHDLYIEHPDIPGKMITRGVSFDLRKGEIFGIAGLMGAGRTELVMSLFGEYGNILSGKILIDGNEVIIKSARDAMVYGISLVPEDRKTQGLILEQSILKNIALPNMNQFSSFGKIDLLKELKVCSEYARSLTVKAPNMHVDAETLSGGNQQKVVISKWLMSNPQVLILDDPTRGIDVGAKYEIYKLMNKLAEEGVAIIMISSELEEVLGMSDRIMVMWEGRSTGILEGEDATQEKVLSLATGRLLKQRGEK